MKRMMLMFAAGCCMAQSPDPLPELQGQVVACRVVAGVLDLITMRQTVFGASPQLIGCTQSILQFPQVAASISTDGSTLSFVCTNLAYVPDLAGVTCPGPMTLNSTSAVATVAVYMGSYGCRVAWSGASYVIGQSGIASDCILSGQLSATPGEYAVARVQVWPQVAGGAPLFQQPVVQLWQGYPVLASVTVIGCDAGAILSVGYTVVQTPWQVTVTCQ